MTGATGEPSHEVLARYSMTIRLPSAGSKNSDEDGGSAWDYDDVRFERLMD